MNGVILTQKYLLLLLLPKSVCFVSYWLNMWLWRRCRNLYFNPPQQQDFANENFALNVVMVVSEFV